MGQGSGWPEAGSGAYEWAGVACALLRHSLEWIPARHGLCGRAGRAPGKAGTLATLPKFPGGQRSRHWASGRREGSPGVGLRLGGGSRGTEKSAGRRARGGAAWVSVPRRLRRRLPGGCGSPGGAGVRAASEGLETATRRCWTRERGPSTFANPGCRQGPPDAPGSAGSVDRGLRGEGFQETKARAGGVGQHLWGLCADTCISRLWVIVDLGPETYPGLRLCVSVALRGCFAPVSMFCGPAFGCGCWWAHGGVPAYVFCACRRVWVGCPWSVCAPRARHRPNSSLSCCPPGPRLGFKLFSGFLRRQRRPSPLQPVNGALAGLPCVVSWDP